MAQTAVCRFHQLQNKANKARCPESCEIRDAFPENPAAGVADQYTRVHAIYGGSNLLSYFRSLAEESWLVTARSLLMIADLWDRNPEGGPKACFLELKVKIDNLKAEGFRSVNGPNFLKEEATRKAASKFHSSCSKSISGYAKSSIGKSQGGGKSKDDARDNFSRASSIEFPITPPIVLPIAAPTVFPNKPNESESAPNEQTIFFPNAPPAIRKIMVKSDREDS